MLSARARVACARSHTHQIPRHANLFLRVRCAAYRLFACKWGKLGAPSCTVLGPGFVNCNPNFVNWIELRNLRRRCTDLTKSHERDHLDGITSHFAPCMPAGWAPRSPTRPERGPSRLHLALPVRSRVVCCRARHRDSVCAALLNLAARLFRQAVALRLHDSRDGLQACHACRVALDGRAIHT
jgi:hypothetical protein